MVTISQNDSPRPTRDGDMSNVKPRPAVVSPPQKGEKGIPGQPGFSSSVPAAVTGTTLLVL